MRDVAEAVNVHHTTVSLALRNSSKLPEKTRNRIQKKAREMGYRIHPQLSTLMATRRAGRVELPSATIAFVSAYPTADGWRQSRNYLRLHNGIIRRAKELGYGIDHVWAREPGMKPNRLSRILYSRGIQGLIIAPLPGTLHRLELDWSLFCSVCCGYTLVDPWIHRVAVDQFQAMSVAFSQLVKRGHRKIAFIACAKQNERVMHRWLGAFLAQKARYKLSSGTKAWMPARISARDVQEWVERHRPDAIISSGTDIPKIKMGIKKLPKPIQLANLDCRSDCGKETGIYQEVEDEGAAATEHVVELIQHNQTGIPQHPRVWTTAVRWVEQAYF